MSKTYIVVIDRYRETLECVVETTETTGLVAVDTSRRKEDKDRILVDLDNNRVTFVSSDGQKLTSLDANNPELTKEKE